MNPKDSRSDPVRLLLLAIFTMGACFASPPEINVPQASWEPIFFKSINSLSEKVAWIPLRQVDLPDGSMEVRVWMGFGLSPLQGIRIRRDGKRWIGFHVKDAFANKRSAEVREMAPHFGWDTLWAKIESLGILTLPDSSTLPKSRQVVTDGVSYVVEINDGGRYRTYHYGNPGKKEWPEAKKVVEIVRALCDELSITPEQGFKS